jgi:phosphatidate cytidylyltransferase
VLGLVATAGDLLESSWKRGHGIKDSGSILPGHGGVLDRFDGFVFAVPLFALLIRFLDVDLFLNSWFT